MSENLENLENLPVAENKDQQPQPQPQPQSESQSQHSVQDTADTHAHDEKPKKDQAPDAQPVQADSSNTKTKTNINNNTDGTDDTNDERSKKDQGLDDALAKRLSSIIEDSNARVIPLTRMIRKTIETSDSQKPDDRDESALVKNVRPLLEQAEKILNETNGAVRGADPDNRLTNTAKRNVMDHRASGEEQRLAEGLKVMVEEVGGTIEWARDKLNSFPKAKRDLGPLLDALGQPLTQIVGGVGLLLAGVLNLVGNLLSGLGLDGLLKGLVAATGLDKLAKGIGLGSWF